MSPPRAPSHAHRPLAEHLTPCAPPVEASGGGWTWQRTSTLIVLLGALAATSAAGEPSAEKVSMVQLLTRPGDYDRRVVEVVGRAELRFEDDQLFPLEPVGSSAIRPPVWLELPSPIAKLRCRFDGARVRVRGRFEAGRSGHFGMNDAALTGIDTFEFADAAEEKTAPPDCFLRVKAILDDGADPRAMLGNGHIEEWRDLCTARAATLWDSRSGSLCETFRLISARNEA